MTQFPKIDRLDLQTFNLDLMLPIRDKMIQFNEFLLSNEQSFVGSTCQNKNLLPFNSETNLIIVENLELELTEFIQVAERASLVQLKAFVRRCLDVILFLEFIE